jgi:hypothetical protein
MHYIIVICGDRTDPAADCRCREIQVLADMPGVLVKFPVAPLAVAPGHPVRYGDPEEDHTAPHDKLLPETGFGDPDVQRRVGVDPLETVGEGEVPVQPRLKPIDTVDKQPGFEGMAGPGRGNGAEGCIGAGNLFDALGAPEQERQLRSRESFFCVRPDTVPFFDRGPEIAGWYLNRLRFREIEDGFFRVGRELKGRLEQVFFLVRLSKVPVFRLLHKEPAGTGIGWHALSLCEEGCYSVQLFPIQPGSVDIFILQYG